ncbi:hypothetical protein SKAU_G00146430 [Synaphobranchus kaupii]|uniref:Uncharacterized protein n=1 Tax=Synaphobranchus kaupii TaxID=118154 RepID=A0A9Q1FTE1_SYNKA|nr:hypothetical protein SKAU_G00146430 [Synaphobranchus kaupii]
MAGPSNPPGFFPPSYWTPGGSSRPLGSSAARTVPPPSLAAAAEEHEGCTRGGGGGGDEGYSQTASGSPESPKTFGIHSTDSKKSRFTGERIVTCVETASPAAVDDLLKWLRVKRFA